MNDRKQCLLVFLAAFLSSMLIVCVLVAERHHDSNWAGNLRIRDDNDFIYFSGSGNGSGFFSGSGMLPDDNITNGTNGTNGTGEYYFELLFISDPCIVCQELHACDMCKIT